MPKENNQLKSKNKSLGALSFKFDETGVETYESKFIMIIAKTMSGKSFLTVNLLCYILKHADIKFQWYDSEDEKFKKIRNVNDLVTVYNIPQHNFIVLDDIYPLTMYTKELIMSILSRGRHYKQNMICCLQSHLKITIQSIINQVSHLFVNSQLLKVNLDFVTDKLDLPVNNLNEIMNDTKLLEDPHQFYMYAQGSYELIPWKNPEYKSKEELYRIVKKRKWTEADEKKEKEKEKENRNNSLSAISNKKTLENIESKKLKKLFNIEDDFTPPNIEEENENIHGDDVMSLINNEIRNQRQLSIYNPFNEGRQFLNFPLNNEF
ncbi:hypothetical protein WA158_005822 [Blastocystis sp. Blastoise]